MQLYKIIPIFLLLLFSTAGIAQELPEGGDDNLTKDDIRRFREKQKVMNIFFDANKAKLAGNSEKALELFRESASNDPSNDAAWFELGMLYYEKKDIEKAIEYTRKAYNLYPRNTWYSLTLAGFYLNNNQPEEARVIYEALITADPDNPEYMFELANIWLMLNKPNEAIKIYERLETKLGVNEELSLRKQRIYLAEGKSKKALEELEKLSAANPYDSRILSMLAEYYLMQGMKNETLETYKKILQIDPGNAYVNISLADFYRQQGEMDKATEALKAGFANPYLDADTKIQVMMSYYAQIGDYKGIEDDVKELSAILTEVHPNDPKALMFRGEMLMMEENYAQARETFNKVNELDPGKYQIWENLLRTDALMEDYRQLIDDSKRAIELFPMFPMPYYFSGFASLMLKNYDDAIKSLQAGIKYVIGDNRLTADFYSMIGDAFHAQKKEKEAFEAYESALRLFPDNALVLNNYAYYLSLRREDLDRAKTMSEKANKLVPGNASYLDTYAWILYQTGNYAEALKYIEQALVAGEEASAVVLEHHGDILFKLDRRIEAVEVWKKAKAAGEGSEFLEQKIKDGKLYE